VRTFVVVVFVFAQLTPLLFSGPPTSLWVVVLLAFAGKDFVRSSAPCSSSSSSSLVLRAHRSFFFSRELAFLTCFSLLSLTHPLPHCSSSP
jgi:hypothetical protein